MAQDTKEAREAADGLERPEAEETQAARRVVGGGKTHTHSDAKPAKVSDQHTERQLDHALDETFPASDPVSISPGAD